MKIIVSETQYRTIISEYYNPETAYIHKRIMDRMRGAPSYLWRYVKGLPRFYIRDENGEPYRDEKGEKIVFTRIPEVIYNYLYGRF